MINLSQILQIIIFLIAGRATFEEESRGNNKEDKVKNSKHAEALVMVGGRSIVGEKVMVNQREEELEILQL